MFLANMINAKLYLLSGLVVGTLVVTAAGQMKRGCQCPNQKRNTFQPSSVNNEEKPSA